MANDGPIAIGSVRIAACLAFPGGAVDKLLLLLKAGWSRLGLKECCILSIFLTQSPHVSLNCISSHPKVNFFFLLRKK